MIKETSTAVDSDNNLVPNICYVHDGKASTLKIEGSRCFDKYTATVKDRAYYCPFDPLSGRYMWIDEYLQGQKAGAD